MANVNYVINLLILLGYFLFNDNVQAWPHAIHIWVWIIYLIYFFLVKYFDGLNNTARNISRIYLMQIYGNHYSAKDHQILWQFLIPGSLFLLTYIWKLMSIISFVTILFFQGWATAIISHISIYVLITILPINYQGYLRKIQNEYSDKMNKSHWESQINARDLLHLKRVVDEAVVKRLNPQSWWADLNHKIQTGETESN